MELYVWHQCRFWDQARKVAREHGFTNVYAEGREGGWLVPDPQPYNDASLADIVFWFRDIFRPFERDVLELMETTREKYLTDLADAVRREVAEPAERAPTGCAATS